MTAALRRALVGVPALCAAIAFSACLEVEEVDPSPMPTREGDSVAVAAYALPPLNPMIDRLRAEQWRIRAPGAVAAARRMYDPPPSPWVHRDADVDAQVRRAIERIATAIESAPAIAPHLRPAIERSRTLTVLVDDEPDAQLRYDALHDALKIPRCVTHYPDPLLAVAVSHELMHAADHRTIASELQIDPEASALLHDIVGVNALAREAARLEERACRIELQLALAMGIEIPPPTGARPPPKAPGCLMTSEQLLVVLAGFRHVEAEPPGAWEQALMSSRRAR